MRPSSRRVRSLVARPLKRPGCYQGIGNYSGESTKRTRKIVFFSNSFYVKMKDDFVTLD